MSTVSENSVFSNMSEWGKAETIIMHTPGDEIKPGLLHPRAALFEKHFSMVQAAEEHRQYVEKLQKAGTRVLTIRALLLGAHDGKLRKLTEKMLTYKYIGEFSADEITFENGYKKELIQKMGRDELFWIITNRPTVKLKKTELNTGLKSSIHLHPLTNLFFLRDQMITTSKGIVLGKMNSSQRAYETDVIRLALKTLEQNPIYKIKDSGRLEGGDFIPAGEVAFLGQGLRTNEAAVKQLIDNDVFGEIKFLVVVKDSHKNQTQMHLDTYFNIIGPKLAVLIKSRFPGNQENFIKTQVDIYERSKDENGKVSFKLNDENAEFTKYLKEKLEITLISVSEEDQQNYGINFLTVEENKIMVAEGISELYKKELESNGVRITEIPLKELRCGYGAAHCTTQVIERS